ncbi:MAG: hypothetical protein JXR07_00075 [Reichenbachiella sp.]
MILSIIIALSALLSDFRWKEMNSIDFELQKASYDKEQIYFYSSLINANNEVTALHSENNFSFKEHAKPLDLFDYWEKRENEEYEILFTKTAYTLDESASYFHKHRLADPKYLAKTMPSSKISLVDSIYYLSVGFGAPDIEYKLYFFNQTELELAYPELDFYFSQHDGIEEKPILTAIQHNFAYSRVLFQRTSKMSVSISRYFELNNNRTLILNYTLNYIHNMPPDFIGGSNYLLERIKAGILELIQETQIHCISNSGQ